MYKIPNENKKFSQENKSDRTGNIYITKNIDFSEPTYLKLAKRTSVVADDATYTNLDDSSCELAAMNFGDNKFWIAGSDKLYYTEMPDTFPVFTQDATTGTPTANNSLNDFVEWDSELYFVNLDTVYRLETDWEVFVETYGYILTVFDSLDYLAVALTHTVELYDKSAVLQQTLIIPDTFTITSITYTNERLYVGARNADSGYTHIFEWDGLSNLANLQYNTFARTVFDSTPYKQGIAATLDNGELIYCYGGIQTLAHFPIYFMDKEWTRTTGRRVESKGMTTVGDEIYIAVNGVNNNVYETEREYASNKFPSGVWCYNPDVGLYHKYSIGSSLTKVTDAIATTAVDISTDIITVAGHTVPETGTPCFYRQSTDSTGTILGGLKYGVRYFIIYVSDTTLKLATTLANANAGTAIDLTGTGNNAQTIIFQENKDFGDIRGIPSVIQTSKESDTLSGRFLIDEVMIGGIVQSGSSTTITNTSLSVGQDYQENRGYFITPKLESSEMEDNFISFNIKWRKMENADDKFVIKYRIADKAIIDFEGYDDTLLTWVDGNSFTTTKDFSNVSVGDEVEITRGTGAGVLAHITVITESAGTYTVTLDEYTVNVTAGDRAFALVTNWTKLDTISQTDSENNRGYKHLQMTKKSKWIQFKVELRGVGTTIEELIINNKTQLPVL